MSQRHSHRRVGVCRRVRSESNSLPLERPMESLSCPASTPWSLTLPPLEQDRYRRRHQYAGAGRAVFAHRDLFRGEGYPT
jgi:hypothetical protein